MENAHTFEFIEKDNRSVVFVNGCYINDIINAINLIQMGGSIIMKDDGSFTFVNCCSTALIIGYNISNSGDFIAETFGIYVDCFAKKIINSSCSAMCNEFNDYDR